MAVYLACNKGGGDCQAERAKAKEALDTYFNQTYLNPKEAQAGYKQIENLLESTDPNAKEVFNILDGYTQAFMTFGYTEEEARARAGTYVGAIYVLGGMSAVLSSNSLTKQFGKDVAADAKPSGNTTPKIDAGKGTIGADKAIPNGNSNLPVVREGKVTYEPLAKPNADEIRAGQKFADQGYDVTYRATASDKGISSSRTSDLYVNGVGKIDVYTPKPTTKIDRVLSSIEKKSDQAGGVIVQIDLSGTEMQGMASRLWGKPNAQNIKTLFFQDSKGTIHRFDRNN